MASGHTLKNSISNSPLEVSFTRDELYELVWAEPMSCLAPKVGLSDVGLAKNCRKLGIPQPPRGYWARVRTGKPIQKTPLPPLQKGQLAKIVIVKNTHKEIIEELPEEVETAVAFEKEPMNHIVVPDRLSHPHPLVATTKRILGSAKKNKYGILTHLIWAHSNEKFLDVRVSKDQLSRALGIMNALLTASEKRGYCVSNEHNGRYPATYIEVLGQKLRIGLREYSRRCAINDGPPKDNRKKTPGWRMTDPGWRFRPTGILSLNFIDWFLPGVQTTWKDGKSQSLESLLNDFMVELVKAGIRHREWKLEHERREREEERLKIERQKREELIKVEKECQQILESQADAWTKSQNIKEFIAEVRNRSRDELDEADTSEELENWTNWASDYAESLDPLAKGISPLLKQHQGKIKSNNKGEQDS